MATSLDAMLQDLRRRRQAQMQQILGGGQRPFQQAPLDMSMAQPAQGGALTRLVNGVVGIVHPTQGGAPGGVAPAVGKALQGGAAIANEAGFEGLGSVLSGASGAISNASSWLLSLL